MSDYNFFSKGSPFLQHPLLTPERTKHEIDFLLQQMELPPGARILDVGCGFGRHSIELARRGYQVTGLDPATAMISAARRRAAKAGVMPDFREVRAEEFRADTPYEAAICLFTTLGQVSSRGESGPGLVASAHRALAPRSPFAVEVPQREPAAREMKAADTYGQGESHTEVSRHFDPGDNTVTEHFTVVSPQKRQVYDLRYRLYSQDELRALLYTAGFAIQAWFGNYAGKPLQEDDATMLVIAEAL